MEHPGGTDKFRGHMPHWRPLKSTTARGSVDSDLENLEVVNLERFVGSHGNRVVAGALGAKDTT